MLFGSDFDGTMAQTFVPSPNGIGVTEAYRLACKAIFGPEFELYDEIGELDNRSPMEIIRALLERQNESVLIEQAQGFLDRNRGSLQGFVPHGKGAGLEWNGKDPGPVVTEVLVRAKMRILCLEIGTRFSDGRVWPEPCAGFLQFYKALRTFAGQCILQGIRLELGVVSSGHDHFIERCFDVWQVPPPELLVTDDLMRSPQCSHIPPEKRVKPQTGPFEMLREECRRKFGAEIGKGGELYIGDSVKTDGGLAKNLGLCFIWFNPDGKSAESFVGNILSISDWRELKPVLQLSTIDMMQRGTDLSHIIHEVLGR